MSEQSNLSPTIIVIFGITGDLSHRYLLPALYHLFKDGLLHEQTEIVGISRKSMTSQQLLDQVELCVDEPDKTCDPDTIKKMYDHSQMFEMDPVKPEDYTRLRNLLDDIEKKRGICMNRLYYLSIPPQVYDPIITQMGTAGLNASCAHGKAMTRLLVEKPFGYDLISAQSLITDTALVFGEEQIFRIDHYMAKETVQNILTFRFANPIFEAAWNKDHIERIEISASEQITIEGRAQFYETVGALRDFIQSHLLQMLAIVTMNKPEIMDSEHIHDSKQKLLEQVEAVPANEVSTHAVRAQYKGYKNEVDNQDSTTETFAGIRVRIENERWKDVPIIIWTGKALLEKKTEISIYFKGRGEQPNRLRFRIQPNEGIELDLLTKKPGFDDTLQTVAMEFSYQQNFNNHDHPNAYERVLVDAVKGDHTLFSTGQEVLAAWRIVQPVIDEWSKNNTNMMEYSSGISGSELAKPLLS
jgi:glucose-6-phosphate 1-dehydrogenase